ncbi:Alkaline ceramidase 3 [Lobulomyces angularis]|nr:Alkaline ceramidase 3 [Lobulomyces angularis]
MHIQGMQLPAGNNGYWGPVTSTLDWCELNYQYNHFVAEMFNTFSNIPFLLLTLLGFYSCFKTSTEPRFLLAYSGLAIVGIGSGLFHGTLTYEMQLMDEKKSLHFVLLSSYSSLLTYVYVKYRDPLIHQAGFMALFVLTIGGILHSIHKSEKLKLVDSKFPLWKIARNAFFSCVFGFTLWNLENFNCQRIRELKEVNVFLEVVLNLHAWWHIFMALGTYQGTVLAQFIRLLVLKKNVRLNYIFNLVPYVEIDTSMNNKKNL